MPQTLDRHETGVDELSFQCDALESEIVLPKPVPDMDARSSTGETEDLHSFQPKEVHVNQLVKLNSDSPKHERRRLDILQQFEGVVSDVCQDSFVATMFDLSDEARTPEIMEFDNAEMSPSDLDILSEGTVFYWTIGYETRNSGQVTRISELRVRRTPTWTTKKLSGVADRAEAIHSKWD